MANEIIKTFNDVVASVKSTEQTILIVFTAGKENSDGEYGLLSSGVIGSARESAKGVLQEYCNKVQAASAVINFPTVDLQSGEAMRLEITAKLAKNE